MCEGRNFVIGRNFPISQISPALNSVIFQNCFQFSGDCGLSRQGLFLVTASFSSLVAALVVVVVALFVKLHYFHSKMGGTEKRKTAATSLTGRQNAKATASRSVETSSRTNNAGGDEEVEGE